jgi:hypothetical protein
MVEGELLMKLTPLKLSLFAAWLMPLVAFPICDTWWKPPVSFASCYSSCYSPIIFLAKTPAADLFVDYHDSYTLNPHWKYWFYWVGAALVLTVYAGRKRE